MENKYGVFVRVFDRDMGEIACDQMFGLIDKTALDETMGDIIKLLMKQIACIGGYKIEQVEPGEDEEARYNIICDDDDDGLDMCVYVKKYVGHTLEEE